MAQIKYIMTTELITAKPSESVLAVVQLMKEKKLGAILIAEGSSLKGIFSERDLLTRVVSEGRDPKTTNIIDVATKDPVTVVETEHVKVCAELLEEHNFRHLPIVDVDGNLTGVISSRDFFTYVTKELERVIDRVRSKEGVTEAFDPYEFFGGGGFGLPRGS
jgi:CBS domain-containing protein